MEICGLLKRGGRLQGACFVKWFGIDHEANRQASGGGAAGYAQATQIEYVTDRGVSEVGQVVLAVFLSACGDGLD